MKRPLESAENNREYYNPAQSQKYRRTEPAEAILGKKLPAGFDLNTNQVEFDLNAPLEEEDDEELQEPVTLEEGLTKQAAPGGWNLNEIPEAESEESPNSLPPVLPKVEARASPDLFHIREKIESQGEDQNFTRYNTDPPAESPELVEHLDPRKESEDNVQPVTNSQDPAQGGKASEFSKESALEDSGADNTTTADGEQEIEVQVEEGRESRSDGSDAESPASNHETVELPPALAFLHNELDAAFSLGIESDLDIIMAVWDAHAQRDAGRMDSTLESALGECGLNPANPSKYHLLSCVYISKKVPRAFSLPRTMQILIGFLRPSEILGNVPPGSKKPVLLPVLACHLLMRAFASEAQWPLEFVQVFLEDAVGPRAWVDNERCRDFASIVLTAIPHFEEAKSAEEVSVSQPAALSSSKAAAASDTKPGDDLTITSGIEPVAPASKGAAKGRYEGEEVREAAKKVFMSVLSSAISSQAVKDNTRNLLKFISMGVGFPEVRAVASGLLEGWLNSPIHLRPARALLDRLLALIGGNSQNDYQTVANLLALKIKGVHGAAMFADVVTQIVRKRAEYASMALKTVLVAEVRKPGAANLKALATALRALPPGSAPEQQLAFILQELATGEEVRPHLLGLLRRMMKACGGLINPCLVCRGLMQPWPAMAKEQSSSKEAWIAKLVNMISLLLLLSAAPALSEDSAAAPSAMAALPTTSVVPIMPPGNASGRDKASLKQVLFEVAALQREAMAWCTDTIATFIPAIDGPTFASCVRRLLALEPPQAQAGGPGEIPGEAEVAVSRQLASKLPVHEDTLARVVIMGILKEFPLNAESALDIVEVVLHRAAHLAMTMDASLHVSNLQLPTAIMKLSAFPMPPGVPPPPISIAVSPLYWRACRAVLILATFNCSTIGRHAWQALPSIRNLMEEFLTCSHLFPHRVDSPALKREDEEAFANLKQSVAIYESQLAQVALADCTLRGLPPPAQPLSLVQWGSFEGKVMVLDSGLERREPPLEQWNELARTDNELRLSQLLRASRDPDFFGEITARQTLGEAWPWLQTVLVDDPPAIASLPPLWQAELLFISTGSLPGGMSPSVLNIPMLQRNLHNIVVRGGGCLSKTPGGSHVGTKQHEIPVQTLTSKESSAGGGPEAGSEGAVGHAVMAVDKSETLDGADASAETSALVDKDGPAFQEAAAVIAYLAAKLAARSSVIRQRANACLASVFIPPVPEDLQPMEVNSALPVSHATGVAPAVAREGKKAEQALAAASTGSTSKRSLTPSAMTGRGEAHTQAGSLPSGDNETHGADPEDEVFRSQDGSRTQAHWLQFARELLSKPLLTTVLVPAVLEAIQRESSPHLLATYLSFLRAEALVERGDSPLAVGVGSLMLQRKLLASSLLNPQPLPAHLQGLQLSAGDLDSFSVLEAGNRSESACGKDSNNDRRESLAPEVLASLHILTILGNALVAREQEEARGITKGSIPVLLGGNGTAKKQQGGTGQATWEPRDDGRLQELPDRGFDIVVQGAVEAVSVVASRLAVVGPGEVEPDPAVRLMRDPYEKLLAAMWPYLGMPDQKAANKHLPNVADNTGTMQAAEQMALSGKTQTSGNGKGVMVSEMQAFRMVCSRDTRLVHLGVRLLPLQALLGACEDKLLVNFSASIVLRHLDQIPAASLQDAVWAADDPVAKATGLLDAIAVMQDSGAEGGEVFISHLAQLGVRRLGAHVDMDKEEAAAVRAESPKAVNSSPVTGSIDDIQQADVEEVSWRSSSPVHWIDIAIEVFQWLLGSTGAAANNILPCGIVGSVQDSYWLLRSKLQGSLLGRRSGNTWQLIKGCIDGIAHMNQNGEEKTCGSLGLRLLLPLVRILTQLLQKYSMLASGKEGTVALLEKDQVADEEEPLPSTLEVKASVVVFRSNLQSLITQLPQSAEPADASARKEQRQLPESLPASTLYSLRLSHDALCDLERSRWSSASQQALAGPLSLAELSEKLQRQLVDASSAGEVERSCRTFVQVALQMGVSSIGQCGKPAPTLAAEPSPGAEDVVACLASILLAPSSLSVVLSRSQTLNRTGDEGLDAPASSLAGIQRVWRGRQAGQSPFAALELVVMELLLELDPEIHSAHFRAVLTAPLSRQLALLLSQEIGSTGSKEHAVLATESAEQAKAKVTDLHRDFTVHIPCPSVAIWHSVAQVASWHAQCELADYVLQQAREAVANFWSKNVENGEEGRPVQEPSRHSEVLLGGHCSWMQASEELEAVLLFVDAVLLGPSLSISTSLSATSTETREGAPVPGRAEGLACLVVLSLAAGRQAKRSTSQASASSEFRASGAAVAETFGNWGKDWTAKLSRMLVRSAQRVPAALPVIFRQLFRIANSCRMEVSDSKPVSESATATTAFLIQAARELVARLQLAFPIAGQVALAPLYPSPGADWLRPCLQVVMEGNDLSDPQVSSLAPVVQRMLRLMASAGDKEAAAAHDFCRALASQQPLLVVPHVALLACLLQDLVANIRHREMGARHLAARGLLHSLSLMDALKMVLIPAYNQKWGTDPDEEKFRPTDPATCPLAEGLGHREPPQPMEIDLNGSYLATEPQTETSASRESPLESPRLHSWPETGKTRGALARPARGKELEAMLAVFFNFLGVLEAQDKGLFFRPVAQLAEFLAHCLAAGGGAARLVLCQREVVEAAKRALKQNKKLAHLLTLLDRVAPLVAMPGPIPTAPACSPVDVALPSTSADVLPPVPVDEIRAVVGKLKKLAAHEAIVPFRRTGLWPSPWQDPPYQGRSDGGVGEEGVHESMVEMLVDLDKAAGRMPAILPLLESVLPSLTAVLQAECRDLAYSLLERLLVHFHSHDRADMVGKLIIRHITGNHTIIARSAAKHAMRFFQLCTSHQEDLLLAIVARCHIVDEDLQSFLQVYQTVLY